MSCIVGTHVVVECCALSERHVVYICLLMLGRSLRCMSSARPVPRSGFNEAKRAGMGEPCVLLGHPRAFLGVLRRILSFGRKGSGDISNNTCACAWVVYSLCFWRGGLGSGFSGEYARGTQGACSGLGFSGAHWFM